MKKILIICLALFLTACSTTVPVVAKFPVAPDVLMEKCPPLKTIEGEHISIIDFTKAVTTNYTLYHECVIKNEAWTLWYNKQKEIFDNIK
jgi:uncharacterized protein YcfL